MKKPSIKQLIDLVNAYNTARDQELRSMPPNGFPADYKNELMDGLYDCANDAAKLLKPVLSANLNLDNRK